MQVNLNPSINQSRPNFKANLKIISKERFAQYIKDNNITNSQIELLKENFAKASKKFEGTLSLDFGTYSESGVFGGRPFVSDPGFLKYEKDSYSDMINANLYNENLTSDDFVKKLVKMLKIFQKREANKQTIRNLNTRINEIEQNIKKDEKIIIEKLFGPLKNLNFIRMS